MSIDHDKKHCESMHGQFPCPMSTHDPDNKECATRKTFAEGYTASCDCPSPEVREEKPTPPDDHEHWRCGNINGCEHTPPSTEEEKPTEEEMDIAMIDRELNDDFVVPSTEEEKHPQDEVMRREEKPMGMRSVKEYPCCDLCISQFEKNLLHICDCHTPWEETLIAQYSKVALLDEDCVDGYRMIPAIDFIRTLLSSRLAEARANERERCVKIVKDQMNKLQTFDAVRIYYLDLLDELIEKAI